MSVLEQMRRKYGFSGGKYEPNPGCAFCSGTGERKRKNGKMDFCVCLFVNHAFSDDVGRGLASVAAEIGRKTGGTAE